MESIWLPLSRPFSALVPLVIVWAFYGREIITHIASLGAEPLRQAGLRRVYAYVMSLYGLVGTFLGIQLLLFGLVNVVLGASAGRVGEMREQLGLGVAALVVGLPLWIVSWRPLVAEAAAIGEAGDRARRSLVRRGYLYLVLFAGVMGVMFTGGMLLFTVISTLLGEPPEDMLLQTLQVLLTLLLCTALLVYHGLALRQDGRMLERALARRLALYPVLLLAPESPEFVDALVGAIEREAPGLPVAVQPISQGAPDETMSAAKAVVLPGELLAKPPEALRLWLQAYSGQRVVLPTPADGLYWVTADRPVDLGPGSPHGSIAAPPGGERLVWANPLRVPGLGQLVQLHQHAVGALRVDEGVLLAAGAPARRLVDQLDAFFLELGQHPGDIVHLQADVVHARAALLQVFRQPRVAGGGLDQLDLALAQPAGRRPAPSRRAHLRMPCSSIPSASRQKPRVFSMSSTTMRDVVDAFNLCHVCSRNPLRISFASSLRLLQAYRKRVAGTRPTALRRTPQISPRVTPLSTHSTNSGIRFSLPRAALLQARQQLAARAALSRRCAQLGQAGALPCFDGRIDLQPLQLELSLPPGRR